LGNRTDNACQFTICKQPRLVWRNWELVVNPGADVGIQKSSRRLPFRSLARDAHDTAPAYDPVGIFYDRLQPVPALRADQVEQRVNRIDAHVTVPTADKPKEFDVLRKKFRIGLCGMLCR